MAFGFIKVSNLLRASFDQFLYFFFIINMSLSSRFLLSLPSQVLSTVVGGFLRCAHVVRHDSPLHVLVVVVDSPPQRTIHLSRHCMHLPCYKVFLCQIIPPPSVIVNAKRNENFKIFKVGHSAAFSMFFPVSLPLICVSLPNSFCAMFY